MRVPIECVQLLCLLCALLTTPHNRGLVLAALVGLGGSASSEADGVKSRWRGSLGRGGLGTRQQQCSSAIAALLSGEATEVLQLAAKRFRTISFAELTADDLATNVAAADLRARTVPAKLGHCDIFLSHSWHDPGEIKWRVLSAWAQEFREANGREPTIWLDKACIDQDDIQASLSCLPVFLAGCSTLLVLSGPTYVSRLWCVMEVFTHIRMGGSVENIRVLPLVVGESEEERMHSARAILEAISTFDASKAKCFIPADRQRLLAVIEMGFGTFSRFNTQVREVLWTSMMQGALPRKLRAAWSDDDAKARAFSRHADKERSLHVIAKYAQADLARMEASLKRERALLPKIYASARQLLSSRHSLNNAVPCDAERSCAHDGCDAADSEASRKSAPPSTRRCGATTKAKGDAAKRPKVRFGDVERTATSSPRAHGSKADAVHAHASPRAPVSPERGKGLVDGVLTA